MRTPLQSRRLVLLLALLMALAVGVPILVLTHLIPPTESDDDVQAFVDDIRTAGYAGELVVAEDLSQVTLG